MRSHIIRFVFVFALLTFGWQASAAFSSGGPATLNRKANSANPFVTAETLNVSAMTVTLSGGGAGPPNDLCGNATSVGAGSFSGTTVGADGDGSSSCSDDSTSSVWYSHTPVSSGLLGIDTVGSDFDTVLSVHSECPGTAANEIACDDDIGNIYQSSVTFPVVGGTTYLIRIAGYDGENGSYTLNIGEVGGLPANDLCADATTVGAGSYSGTTGGADDDGSSSCSSDDPSTNSVWYSHTPISSGPLTIDTLGSLVDTVLSVHSECPGTAANEVACNDDTDDFYQSSVTFTAVGMTTYLIRVAGYDGDNGPYTLNISGPTSSPFDLNVDGFIDDADVDMLVNFIIGPRTPNLSGTASSQFDLNVDGFVDAADVVTLVNFINFFML